MSIDVTDSAGAEIAATEEIAKLDVGEFMYAGVDLSNLKKAIDCWKQGMVDREVSEELAIPMVYVSSIRKFLGLNANYKHVSTRSRRIAARAMQKEGLGAAEIAKMFKVHASLVSAWLEMDE